MSIATSALAQDVIMRMSACEPTAVESTIGANRDTVKCTVECTGHWTCERIYINIRYMNTNSNYVSV